MALFSASKMLWLLRSIEQAFAIYNSTQLYIIQFDFDSCTMSSNLIDLVYLSSENEWYKPDLRI